MPGVLGGFLKPGFNAIDAVADLVSFLDEFGCVGLDDFKITIEALKQRFFGRRGQCHPNDRLSETRHDAVPVVISVHIKSGRH
jgi:hypothetical protein